jgi:single-strand DNA-binding protein
MLNRIQLIGRLGQDPHIAMTTGGSAVGRFTVAVHRPRAKASAEKAKPADDTQWFNIVVWDRLAETCERLLHTGDLVYIEGRMNSRVYTDRDGQERTVWEVTATDIQLLVSRRPPSSPAEERGGVEEDSGPTSATESSEGAAQRRAAALSTRSPAGSASYTARSAEWRAR